MKNNKINKSKKYFADFNYFDFQVKGSIVALCSQSGNMEDNIRQSLEDEELKEELSKLDPDKIRIELKECGTWDEEELKDNEANISRLLWVACGNISENVYTGEYKD